MNKTYKHEISLDDMEQYAMEQMAKDAGVPLEVFISCWISNHIHNEFAHKYPESMFDGDDEIRDEVTVDNASDVAKLLVESGVSISTEKLLEKREIELKANHMGMVAVIDELLSQKTK